MLAIVAPGQGAQTPGFLTDWLGLPRFQQGIAALSETTELDLAALGTGADADTIRDTAIAQPLLVVAGLLTAAELLGEGTPLPQHCILAGHSVGEITVASLAGVLTAEDAAIFVRERGRAMAQAAALTPTSMTAVIAGDRDEVLAAIDAAGLTAANNNGPGQIVAAGTVEQLTAFAEQPPRRARLIPLSVAGAFHTMHMQPAVDSLAAVAAGLRTADPTAPLLTNADGSTLTEGAAVISSLVNQVANPVRWDLCLDSLSSHGVTGLLELTPAGTLTGIAKRNLKGVELFSLNTPDQLDEARAFVQHHDAA